MKLVKARVRGLGALSESEWFELSPSLNLFQFAGQDGEARGGNFLRLLQSINPTYAVQARRPFASYPHIIKVNGQSRRIHPAKRTIAMGVFSATPELVHELSFIADWFYETDRIEVGRRFDYSQWINFVELASSTRWSEISSTLEDLLRQARKISSTMTAPPDEMSRLQPADRILGTVQDHLTQWLQQLPSELQQSARQQIAISHTAIMRATHFEAARVLVRRRLPLFVVLGTEGELRSVDSLLQLISQQVHTASENSLDGGRLLVETLNEQLEKVPFFTKKLRLEDFTAEVSAFSPLAQMQAKAALAIAYSRTVCRSEPILLFAGPERHLQAELHPELATFIRTVAKTCQCLFCYGEVDIFPDKADYKHYSDAADTLLLMPVDEAQ